VDCPLMQNKCPDKNLFSSQISPSCTAFSPPCSLPLSSPLPSQMQPNNSSPPLPSLSRSPTFSSQAQPNSSSPPSHFPPVKTFSSSSLCSPAPSVCPMSMPVAEPGPYCLSGTSKYVMLQKYKSTVY
jgi:hypothetical protein